MSTIFLHFLTRPHSTNTLQNSGLSQQVLFPLTSVSLSSHVPWIIQNPMCQGLLKGYVQTGQQGRVNTHITFSPLFTQMIGNLSSCRTSLQNTGSKIKLFKLSRWKQQSIRASPDPSDFRALCLYTSHIPIKLAQSTCICPKILTYLLQMFNIRPSKRMNMAFCCVTSLTSLGNMQTIFLSPRRIHSPCSLEVMSLDLVIETQFVRFSIELGQTSCKFQQM